MFQNRSIQLKAGVLLIAFGLNTVVGFACAMGLDMGFNNTHHHEEETIKVHVHGNGKKHEHHKKSANHQHTENKEKDGCCNNSAVTFSQTDKSVPPPGTIISPVFFTSFIASCFSIDILYTSPALESTRYFVRNYHPPIPDIRIAIQSFQI